MLPCRGLLERGLRGRAIAQAQHGAVDACHGFMDIARHTFIDIARHTVLHGLIEPTAWFDRAYSMV
jgi:hypothetical protein